MWMKLYLHNSLDLWDNTHKANQVWLWIPGSSEDECVSFLVIICSFCTHKEAQLELGH